MLYQYVTVRIIKKVVKAYMTGDKSISRLSIDFNIAKNTIRNQEKNITMNAKIP